ncbi:hypothetical protein F5Y18DRAFT_444786 [Xylariaceae sp. FL1019]|nr:hypothetical protein F5Y18DRAFT_444786 [Xylariaceae sp. FL1019]
MMSPSSPDDAPHQDEMMLNRELPLAYIGVSDAEREISYHDHGEEVISPMETDAHASDPQGAKRAWDVAFTHLGPVEPNKRFCSEPPVKSGTLDEVTRQLPRPRSYSLVNLPTVDHSFYDALTEMSDGEMYESQSSGRSASSSHSEHLSLFGDPDDASIQELAWEGHAVEGVVPGLTEWLDSRSQAIEEPADKVDPGFGFSEVSVYLDMLQNAIQNIKSITPRQQIDRDTAQLLVREVMAYMTANSLVTAEDVMTLDNIFSSCAISISEKTSPSSSDHSYSSESQNEAEAVPDYSTGDSPSMFIAEDITGAGSQLVPDSKSQDLSLSTVKEWPEVIESALSEIKALNKELGSDIVSKINAKILAKQTGNDSARIQYATRATQTEPSLCKNRENTKTNAKTQLVVSDLEYWKRGLESIRRDQPLVTTTPLIEIKTLLRPTAKKAPTTTNGNFSGGSTSSLCRSTKASNIKATSSLKTTAVVDLIEDSDDEPAPARRRSSRVGGGGNQKSFPSRDVDDYDEVSDPYSDGSDSEKTHIDENVQTRYGGDDTDITMFNSFHHGKETLYKSCESTGPLQPYQTRGTTNGNSRVRSIIPADTQVFSGITNGYEHGQHNGNSGRRLSALSENRAQIQGVATSLANNVPFIYGQTRYTKDQTIEVPKQPTEPELPSFYGSGNDGAKRASIVLRYQDRMNQIGHIPAPTTGLRLKLDEYFKDSAALRDPPSEQIKAILQTTSYSGATMDEEQAIQKTWLPDKDKILYRGFPLVEDIQFIAAGNHHTPNGDCYWRSLSYVLQGTRARWELVKAEHLEYMFHVLSDSHHPRHDLYAKELNTKFFLTRGSAGDHPDFKANLWQLFHMPHTWTPGVMQQITADLYNIHLVTFTVERTEWKCTEVSVRGVYNSRHVFMLFVDGNHFQPLLPNEYLS